MCITSGVFTQWLQVLNQHLLYLPTVSVKISLCTKFDPSMTLFWYRSFLYSCLSFAYLRSIERWFWFYVYWLVNCRFCRRIIYRKTFCFDSSNEKSVEVIRCIHSFQHLLLRLNQGKDLSLSLLFFYIRVHVQRARHLMRFLVVKHPSNNERIVLCVFFIKICSSMNL